MKKHNCCIYSKRNLKKCLKVYFENKNATLPFLAFVTVNCATTGRVQKQKQAFELLILLRVIISIVLILKEKIPCVQ